jgi:hypothetical protein
MPPIISAAGCSNRRTITLVTVLDLKSQLVTRLNKQIETLNDPTLDHFSAIQYSLGEMIADFIVTSYGNSLDDYDDGVGELGSLMGHMRRFHPDFSNRIA